MGYSFFDYQNKRYWMSAGNVRTCRDIESQKKPDLLKEFLKRNAVSITTPAEATFRHEMEQVFSPVQRPAGVPETEHPVGVIPEPDPKEK